ncbi:immediate early response gene 5 protein-like [Homarus americanus]|uniref:immediate early response gene 5 protein-like n=1 Tax=Homarus americanus TaxID=6706 RepID=UPI001C47A694|nr:immediate early response gene 5 protein-like [Homarus americanus]
MACDSRAGLEAQKLISISLGKMAASRVGRTGASLHKSLLVASVLHRARHVFLEESYHVHRAAHPEAYTQAPTDPTSSPVVTVYAPLIPPAPPATPSTPALLNEDNSDGEDKENRVCEKPQHAGEGGRVPLSDNNSSNSRVAALKRRRCVSQQETQEAVWSILPKRPRTTTSPEPRSCPTPDPAPDHHDSDTCGNSMEVEHITSLVSIFSFGGQRVDLCGAQAAREDLAQYQPVALAV